MVRHYWDEEWREIEFEKGKRQLRYAVSNYGRVVSYRDRIEDGNLLKGSAIGGYPTLKIRVQGKSKTFFIHKLVAEYFIENEVEGDSFVIHWDYNKKNNHVENLAWVSKRRMFAHQQKNPNVLESRIKRREKKTYQGHKLTATQVMLIKKRIFDPNRKTRMKIIAKQFGISEMQLYRIKSGENWGHVKLENEDNVEIPEKEPTPDNHK